MSLKMNTTTEASMSSCTDSKKFNYLPPINQKPGKNLQKEVEHFLSVFNECIEDDSDQLSIYNIKKIIEELDLSTLRLNQVLNNILQPKQTYITFDIFLQIITQIQNKNSSLIFQTDQKLLQFIKMLDEFRKKSDLEGNYHKANQSLQKIKEIQEREKQRQDSVMQNIQQEELRNIQLNQTNQFNQFTSAWDKYIQEYEATAYLQIERLKQKHQQELDETERVVRNDLLAKIKFSKNLLDLRYKEKLYAKQQDYEMAEIIQKKADGLENKERKQKELEIEEQVELKLGVLANHQKQVLQVLLKKIQTDRQQQIQRRQKDSNKIVLKNKNIKNELESRHNIDKKRNHQTIEKKVKQIIQNSSNQKRKKHENKENRHSNKRNKSFH